MLRCCGVVVILVVDVVVVFIVVVDVDVVVVVVVLIAHLDPVKVILAIFMGASAQQYRRRLSDIEPPQVERSRGEYFAPSRIPAAVFRDGRTYVRACGRPYVRTDGPTGGRADGWNSWNTRIKRSYVLLFFCVHRLRPPYFVTDVHTYGHTDGRTYRRTDQRADGRTDGIRGIRELNGVMFCCCLRGC